MCRFFALLLSLGFPFGITLAARAQAATESNEGAAWQGQIQIIWRVFTSG
jgi:hypothetical protein